MTIVFDCSSLFRDGRVESGIPTYSVSLFQLLKRTENEIVPFYSGFKTYGLEEIVESFLHLPFPNKLIQLLTFCGVNFDWMIGTFGVWRSGRLRADNRSKAKPAWKISFKQLFSGIASSISCRRKGAGFDIYFTPNVSTFYRCFSPRVRVVGVVHDLTQTLFPELKPWKERWKYAIQTKAHILERLAFWVRNRKPILERFSHFVAISEHTKRDLVEYAGVPGERITVIYPQARESGIVNQGSGEPSVLRTFAIRKPFLLFLGHIEPRKNVENVIRAFALVKQTRTALQFVAAGRLGHQCKQLLQRCRELGLSFGFQAANGKSQDVIFTGHVSEDEKYHLMQNAEAFLYPSLYEGFAYPCLEAMSVGTPVVASPVSALPEVLGDGALYADPWRPEEIASVVLELLNDGALRARLVDKGRECVKQYQRPEAQLKQWNDLFKQM